LPDDAIVLPAPPEDPYSNTSLDSTEALGWLEAAIATVKPKLVFVDTLTYATSRDLCEQRSIAILKAPLVELVQQYQINLFLLLHVSKEGQALGRRIKGITRSLIHLECPDPDQPERLRLWVEKSYAQKPPPLGVTIAEFGNLYDEDPPVRPEPNKGGRPSNEKGKAERFIRDALTKENGQIGNDLCREWDGKEGSKTTFWRAVREMERAGDLTLTGGKGTGQQTALNLVVSKPQNP
jgi:hypothetical protein